MICNSFFSSQLLDHNEKGILKNKRTTKKDNTNDSSARASKKKKRESNVQVTNANAEPKSTTPKQQKRKNKADPASSAGTEISQNFRRMKCAKQKGQSSFRSSETGRWQRGKKGATLVSGYDKQSGTNRIQCNKLVHL